MILESERRAIVDTLIRYCTAIDTGAWELLGDVFLPTFLDEAIPVVAQAQP